MWRTFTICRSRTISWSSTSTSAESSQATRTPTRTASAIKSFSSGTWIKNEGNSRCHTSLLARSLQLMRPIFLTQREVASLAPCPNLEGAMWEHRGQRARLRTTSRAPSSTTRATSWPIPSTTSYPRRTSAHRSSSLPATASWRVWLPTTPRSAIPRTPSIARRKALRKSASRPTSSSRSEASSSHKSRSPSAGSQLIRKSSSRGSLNRPRSIFPSTWYV